MSRPERRLKTHTMWTTLRASPGTVLWNLRSSVPRRPRPICAIPSSPASGPRWWPAFRDDLHGILGPLGYTRTADEWRRSSLHGHTLVQLQRARSGDRCFVNAGARGRWERAPHDLAGTHDGFALVRPGAFCPDFPADCRPDGFSYVRLHDDPPFRAAVLALLEQRIVPWLERRHTWAARVSMPAPGDMARAHGGGRGNENRPSGSAG